MQKLKVSDFISLFLEAQGIRHVFLVSGGASIHLLHSLNNSNRIRPIPVHHEQAAAMAADGYARLGESIGVAVATSGPGATNLLTGIAGSWFDSIPCLYITGQVATFRMKGSSGVRQLGFQETDIVSMASPITKWSTQVNSTEDVHQVLQKAIDIAISDRPGPVLVDIPDDIQRSVGEFDLQNLVRKKSPIAQAFFQKEIHEIINILKDSERPVIVFGAGANQLESREVSRDISNFLQIPTLVTWGAKDLITQESPYLLDTFGSHGTRWGNFVIQNADLVLAFGTRLSTRETGGDLKSWARQAKLVHIDIDINESRKLFNLGKEPTLSVQTDLKHFLPLFFSLLKANLPEFTRDSWLKWAVQRKVKYRYQVSPHSNLSGYDFYLALKQFLEPQEHIFLDTGCTVAWAMQCLELAKDMRIFHDNNNTAMGWALPASLGGALAAPSRPITCIIGDGSSMMNIQELASISRNAPQIKIILLNNQGYGMVRQTEDQWLESKHVGTDSRVGDITFPDFKKLAESFGLKPLVARNKVELTNALVQMYANKTSSFLEVCLNPESKVTPQVRFGSPLEDSEPRLSHEELKSNMLIPLIDNDRE